MKLLFTAILLLLTSVHGAEIKGKLAAKLLEIAKVDEQASSRRLQDDEDFPFLASYALRYTGCVNLLNIDVAGAIYYEHWAKFSLCPSCSSCDVGGGNYMVNLYDFINIYTENKLNNLEYSCERIRQNCYCENDNDDQVCMNQCFYDSGMEQCIELEGGPEYDMQRFLQCSALNKDPSTTGNVNHNNKVDSVYFAGPYCADDTFSIFMGVFEDSKCMQQTNSSIYAYFSDYQAPLPFANSSIINTLCVSCLQINDDTGIDVQTQSLNSDTEQFVQINTMCEYAYEQAVRCEEGMNKSFVDTSGCEYINEILPRLEGKVQDQASSESAQSILAAVGWIWLVVVAGQL